MDDETEEVTEWTKLKKSLAVNKPLIPLKLTMLLYYGGASLFLPYLTLQMVQVGLNIEEIAIIYSVLPFVTCIMPPIAGLLADKFNRYKLFLVGSVVCCAIFHTLLLHIDARIAPDASAEQSIREGSAELLCTRGDSALLFGNWTLESSNCSHSWKSRTWTALLTPSACQPLLCHGNHVGTPEMHIHFSRDNRTRVNMQSDFPLSMQLVLGDDELDMDKCLASVVEVRVEQVEEAGLISCHCPISCPLTIYLPPGPVSEHERNATRTLKEIEHSNHNRGFWIYFFFRICASGALATSFSMLDATAICMVKEFQGDLGKQRLFGVVGQAVFVCLLNFFLLSCHLLNAKAMVAGIILDWTADSNGSPNYSIMFYLADGIFLIVVLLVCKLNVDVEHVEAGNLASGVKKLVRLVDVDVFMLMMLFLGSCWGFLESFLFVFLMELQANSYLLGMTVTLGCVVGVPFLYISDTIVRKVGSVNIFVIAFVIYCARFFGYSLIWNPWLCLPFEALEAVTVHMMAVASSMYCAAAAPPGLLATLNGAVGSVHYSFGRGVGSFTGGILMATYGTRITFQIFGSFAGVCAIVYFVLHRTYLIKIERLRLRRKSEHIMEVIASGGTVPDEEPEQEYIIPPDNLMGRRISCF